MGRKCAIKGKEKPLFDILRAYLKGSFDLRDFSSALLAEEVDGFGICIALLPKLLNVVGKTESLKVLSGDWRTKCLSVLCALSERSEGAVNKDALLGLMKWRVSWKESS
ncbi:MAG: hypothetical protein SWH78_01505 [Thermodesulfobacteriota bacterium]|nr:hypothetical protein [Thermodesulfobacteriota bacterium]